MMYDLFISVLLVFISQKCIRNHLMLTCFHSSLYCCDILYPAASIKYRVYIKFGRKTKRIIFIKWIRNHKIFINQSKAEVLGFRLYTCTSYWILHNLNVRHPLPNIFASFRPSRPWHSAELQNLCCLLRSLSLIFGVRGSLGCWSILYS